MTQGPFISPQLARSLRAEKNRWRQMEEEFGLLDSLQVSELLTGTKIRSLTRHRADGKILGVKRGRSFLYPGFQLDAETGNVREVIPRLIRLARENSWSDQSLALWMCSGTGYLEDEDRPVDRLDEPDAVLDAAARTFGEEW